MHRGVSLYFMVLLLHLIQLKLELLQQVNTSIDTLSFSLNLCHLYAPQRDIKRYVYTGTQTSVSSL